MKKKEELRQRHEVYCLQQEGTDLVRQITSFHSQNRDWRKIQVKLKWMRLWLKWFKLLWGPSGLQREKNLPHLLYILHNLTYHLFLAEKKNNHLMLGCKKWKQLLNRMEKLWVKIQNWLWLLVLWKTTLKCGMMLQWEGGNKIWKLEEF